MGERHHVYARGLGRLRPRPPASCRVEPSCRLRCTRGHLLRAPPALPRSQWVTSVQEEWKGALGGGPAKQTEQAWSPQCPGPQTPDPRTPPAGRPTHQGRAGLPTWPPGGRLQQTPLSEHSVGWCVFPAGHGKITCIQKATQLEHRESETTHPCNGH